MASPNDVTTRVARISRGADLAWVAEALVERRDEILARWREVSARQPFHRGRRAPAVADHIPTLFDAIVALLQRTAPRSIPTDAPLEDPAVFDAARQHAAVRFTQGLGAADVVTEFRLLRQEIGRAIRAEVQDDAPTGDVVGAELLVHDALDGAIALALNALSLHLEELREEFLATTLHDVQQPVTAIKGNLQLAARQLKRANPDIAGVAELLRRAESETNRMSLLLGTLSDASRLTLGRLEPHTEETDLAAIVDRVIERLESEAAARVRHEPAPPSANLSGSWDPGMLDRVVSNLLSNALKYSAPDSPVVVELEASDDSVKLAVSDYGIGLSEDELPRLFRRYGRAGGALAAGVEGQGLGLFLSKGIVEAHGGRIWAESRGPGRGTTVSLTLPRVFQPPDRD